MAGVCTARWCAVNFVKGQYGGALKCGREGTLGHERIH